MTIKYHSGKRIQGTPDSATSVQGYSQLNAGTNGWNLSNGALDGQRMSLQIVNGSAIIGNPIKQIKMKLNKNSSPDSTFYVRVRDSSDNILAYASKLASTISSSLTEYTFTLNTGVVLAVGDRINAEYIGKESAGSITVGVNNATEPSTVNAQRYDGNRFYSDIDRTPDWQFDSNPNSTISITNPKPSRIGSRIGTSNESTVNYDSSSPVSNGSANFYGNNGSDGDNMLFGSNTDWNFLHNGGSWTISFWMKPTDVSDRMVFNTNGTTNTNIGIQSILTGGNLRTRMGNGSGDWVTVTKSSFSTNTWYFLVITFDGTTLSVKSSTYGGSLGSATTGTKSGSPSSANSLNSFTIGSASDNSTTYPFRGLINSFMVWDRVLTSTEINTIHGASGNGSESYATANILLRTCLHYTGEQYQWFVNRVGFTDIQIGSRFEDTDLRKIHHYEITQAIKGVSTDGDYTVLQFTDVGSNTFTPASSFNVEYLVIAGGGSGGSDNGGYGSGGGGAGGYKTGTHGVTAQAYTITIGAGGATVSGNSPLQGNQGGNTVFSSITSTGGGSGGRGGSGSTSQNGGSGGSGGGGGDDHSGGSGTSGQGNTGGNTGYGDNGAGGGGSSQDGGNTTVNQNGGVGGAGSVSSITGTEIIRAGGGGGTGGATGIGGSGGGGQASHSDVGGRSGEIGTGSGGGGATSNGLSGAGGSGIVILRFLSSNSYTSSLFTAGTEVSWKEEVV